MIEVTNGHIKQNGRDRGLIRSWPHCQLLADTMTRQRKSAGSATVCLPVDRGRSCWPRFDVIEAPKVGEEVSFGFNGDYYPAGKIERISPSFHTVWTSEGKTFRRRGRSACWTLKGGTWSMVRGRHSRLNPSF